MALSPEVQKIGREIKSRVAKLDTVLQEKRQEQRTNPNSPSTSLKSQVFGEPTARRGENVMSSRGFQFQRLIGAIANENRGTPGFSRDNAKLELDVHDRMTKTYVGEQGFQTAHGGYLAPFGTELMGGASEIDDNFRHEMKSLVCAGTFNADPDEMAWIAKKAYRGSTKAVTTPQSWLDETLGGSLVAPPEFGELIQLLRNKDALINAGCRVIPMPPSGRVKYPRQTAPSSGYWVGENASITSSNYNTGTLLLSAKKCAALVGLPNELIRFASPSSEALLRADMTKTLSLTFDKACLQGPGSDNVPLGVLNTPNTTTVTPTTAATTNAGGIISPQDVYKFISQVEANNAEFQGWIMRPEMFFNLVASRTTTYSSSGQVGQFTFDQFRNLGQGWQKTLAGYPVVTTPQVSNNLVQGSSSNNTYILGGQWDDSIMALFGSIEFAQATQGDSAFQNDQTIVRAILSGDFGLRHQGAFAVMSPIQVSVGN